jgi:methylase of polypeptide subunit release factors
MQDIEEIKANAIYKNAFEWRFEFPEVLSDAGEFVGFDVVVGNPPYINAMDLKKTLPEALYKTLKFYYLNQSPILGTS